MGAGADRESTARTQFGDQLPALHRLGEASWSSIPGHVGSNFGRKWQIYSGAYRNIRALNHEREEIHALGMVHSQASRGRVAVVRAGGCPFGFKNSAGKVSRESAMERNVATANPGVNTPYAPAPSSDAPDHVNLGPGASPDLTLDS